MRWVIWPDSATAANYGADIELGGHVVADGDELSGSGTLADVVKLRAWDKAYGLPLEEFGLFCSADKLGVVVLDDATVTTR